MVRTSQGGLGLRVLFLIALFAAEAAVASIKLDGSMPFPHDAWLTWMVHHRGAFAARAGIGFAGLFATFAYLRFGAALARLSQSAAGRIRGSFLAAHVLAMAVFALLSRQVYGGSLTVGSSNLASAGWLAAAAAAVVTAVLSVFPWDWLCEIRRITGWLWAYSAAAAIAAASAFQMLHRLWGPTSRLTFWMVQWMGRPFFGKMVIDPARLIVGTQRFKIMVADECSGLEGIGLMLVFGLIWLVLFRDEIRFPRALLLLPAGVVVLFVLNSVRILGLIAIGTAGARDIALGGFHSQAGWLAFNSVAFGLCLAARSLPWISVREPQQAIAIATVEREDSTAALLAPFLAILAASMISRAVSGSFEWWYALRFLAAGVVLTAYRQRYRGMGWRPGWAAVGLGVVVFALWLSLERIAGGGNRSPMPPALAAAPAGVRAGWIALRFLGATLTVPIAEELAFRGYAMRRLVSPDFESVSPRVYTVISLVVSSLLFGFLHGNRWLAGTLAGLIYAVALLRRGRIGDAVAAHATTNALLAVYVLSSGQWQFW
jgi:exosortase E/protease (VPEID-CTERM system)